LRVPEHGIPGYHNLGPRASFQNFGSKAPLMYQQKVSGIRLARNSEKVTKFWGLLRNEANIQNLRLTKLPPKTINY
jgi:hypothetical protein